MGLLRYIWPLSEWLEIREWRRRSEEALKALEETERRLGKNPLKVINGWHINKVGSRFEAERDGYSMPFFDLAGAVIWAVENPQPR